MYSSLYSPILHQAYREERWNIMSEYIELDSPKAESVVQKKVLQSGRGVPRYTFNK